MRAGGATHLGKHRRPLGQTYCLRICWKRERLIPAAVQIAELLNCLSARALIITSRLTSRRCRVALSLSMSPARLPSCSSDARLLKVNPHTQTLPARYTEPSASYPLPLILPRLLLFTQPTLIPIGAPTQNDGPSAPAATHAAAHLTV